MTYELLPEVHYIQPEAIELHQQESFYDSKKKNNSMKRNMVQSIYKPEQPQRIDIYHDEQGYKNRMKMSNTRNI